MNHAQSINRYAWSFIDANNLPSFSRFFRRFSVIKTCLLMNIISAAGKLALTKDPQLVTSSPEKVVFGRINFDGLVFGRINFARVSFPPHEKKAQRGVSAVF